MQSAIKEKLQAYFQHSLQYEIPFFQRTYVWRKENWDHLLEHAEAEVAAVRTRPNSEHFIGTIITKQMPQLDAELTLRHLLFCDALLPRWLD